MDKNFVYNNQLSFFPVNKEKVSVPRNIKKDKYLDKDLNDYINSLIAIKINNYIKSGKNIDEKIQLENTEKILQRYKILKDTESEEIQKIGIILKSYIEKSIGKDSKNEVQNRKNRILNELYINDNYKNQQQFMDENYYDAVQFYRDKKYLLRDLSNLFF